MIQIKNRFTGELILELENLQRANLQRANLRGADLQDADLRGADLQGAAVIVNGQRWDVYITNGHIRIGCQAHELKAWENFTDHEVSEMSEGALDFWNANKTWVLATCRSITKAD